MNSLIHEPAWRSALYCLFVGAISLFSMLTLIRQIAQERQNRINAELAQFVRADQADAEEDEEDPAEVLRKPVAKSKSALPRYLLIMAHALVVLGSCFFGLPALKAARYTHLGNAAFEAHDYEGAVNKYNIALESNPTAAALLTQSQNALAQRDAGGELGNMRRLVNLHPGDDRNHNDLGNALMQHNDMAGAIKEYQKAVALNPQSPIAHNNLGNAYQAAHRYPESITELRQAIHLDPEQVPTYYNLANTLMANRETEEAIKYYRIAVGKNPKLAPAYYNLAEALNMQGKRTEAMVAMDTFVQVAPKQPAFSGSIDKAKKQLAEWRTPH